MHADPGFQGLRPKALLWKQRGCELFLSYPWQKETLRIPPRLLSEAVTEGWVWAVRQECTLKGSDLSSLSTCVPSQLCLFNIKADGFSGKEPSAPALVVLHCWHIIDGKQEQDIIISAMLSTATQLLFFFLLSFFSFIFSFFLSFHQIPVCQIVQSH